MTILAAVDGKRNYDRVVEVGAELADAYGEELVVVHVMPNEAFAERQDTGQDYYLDTAEEDARGTARSVVRTTLESFEGVTVRGLVGEVTETILREVGYQDARFLVVGGKRRSPIGKAVFGDVTQDLLLKSTSPVVTVFRDPYDARADGE